MLLLLRYERFTRHHRLKPCLTSIEFEQKLNSKDQQPLDGQSHLYSKEAFLTIEASLISFIYKRECMKFIHTSDWHIGRQLHNQSLLDDQRHVLLQIIEMAKEQNVDALIIGW